MNNFKRGTVLKLTCDIHEFLSKAPKAYEDLIDIIDKDGAVKVKTHNGDYVGFYGMKAKIHTRFMKQFIDVTPGKIEVPVVELDDGHMEAINEQVATLEFNPVIEIEKQIEIEELNPNIGYAELKDSLLEGVTDSLALAASKLNSLGYEFTGCDWMHQDDIKKYKISAMANKIYEMTAIEVAELLVKHNIEL